MTLQISQLEGKLDDLGQESRSTVLLVHGVRDVGTTPQEMRAKVIGILNEKISEAKLVDNDITGIERMGSSRSSAQAADRTTQGRKVSPILLKFSGKESRDRVLRNRRHLKATGVSVTEQLTPRKSALLKRASDLVRSDKLEAAWSHDGKIIVKDKGNKVLNICAASELDCFD